MNAEQERLAQQYDQELGDGERLMLSTLLSFGFQRHVPTRFLMACYGIAAREHELADDEDAASKVLDALPDEFVMCKCENGRESLKVAWLRERVPRDFVRSRLLENPPEIKAMLARACYFEQVHSLVDLARSDGSLALSSLVEPLTTAVSRTIELRDPTLYSWEPPGAAEKPEVLSRLRVLSEWCKEAPELSDLLSALLARIVPGLLEPAPDEEVDVLTSWVELLVGLDECHLEIDSIVRKVKACAFSREEYLVPLEELVKLRKLRPALFDKGESDSLKAYFREWTDDCLKGDGTDEWDRSELGRYDHEDTFYFVAKKLNRIEALAGELDVALKRKDLRGAWMEARSDYVSEAEHCDDFDGTFPLLDELGPLNDLGPDEPDD